MLLRNKNQIKNAFKLNSNLPPLSLPLKEGEEKRGGISPADLSKIDSKMDDCKQSRGIVLGRTSTDHDEGVKHIRLCYIWGIYKRQHR